MPLEPADCYNGLVGLWILDEAEHRLERTMLGGNEVGTLQPASI